MCERWGCPFCLYRDCALPTGEDCIYEEEDREQERQDDCGDELYLQRVDQEQSCHV